MILGINFWKVQSSHNKDISACMAGKEDIGPEPSQMGNMSLLTRMSPWDGTRVPRKSREWCHLSQVMTDHSQTLSVWNKRVGGTRISPALSSPCSPPSLAQHSCKESGWLLVSTASHVSNKWRYGMGSAYRNMGSRENKIFRMKTLGEDKFRIPRTCDGEEPGHDSVHLWFQKWWRRQEAGSKDKKMTPVVLPSARLA